MRKLFFGLCGFVVVTSVFIACGKQEASDDLEWYRMRGSVTREEFAAAFPLLNTKGEEARPVGPDGTSPFAALLMFKKSYYSNSYSYAFCSASHVSPGRAATNAHCTEDVHDAGNLFLIYYDKSGMKRYTQAKRVTYEGERKNFDVAILELDETADARWDVLTDSVATAATSTAKKMADGPLAITIWSFDPSKDAEGRSAMTFHPKQCTATRKIPQVIAFDKEGKRTRFNFVSTNYAIDSATHAMFESCDSFPIQGNSGSIVTPSDSMRQPIGVMHWVFMLTQKDFTAYERFEITGAKGTAEALDTTPNMTWRPESGEPEKRRGIFAVGTTFDAVLKKVPDAFTARRDRWEAIPTPTPTPTPTATSAP